MLSKIKRTISSIIKTDQSKFESHLKNQHFYPISYSEPQDIFIAGYPKSGNTWMQNILATLIFSINPQFLPDKLTQELVPDVHNKIYYKRFLPFCCFKTHSLPKPEYKKVIHLVRDGRDAMASYFAMNRVLKKEITLEQMILEGKGIVPCKWHEHAQKWIENPYGAEIIQVKYEDLLNNPKFELEKICTFIGITRSEAIIENCIEGNAFKSMQKKEEKYGMNNKNWNKNDKFNRKGKIGTYKTEIPENLIGHFTDESQKELELFGYI